MKSKKKGREMNGSRMSPRGGKKTDDKKKEASLDHYIGMPAIRAVIRRSYELWDYTECVCRSCRTDVFGNKSGRCNRGVDLWICAACIWRAGVEKVQWLCTENRTMPACGRIFPICFCKIAFGFGTDAWDTGFIRDGSALLWNDYGNDLSICREE